MDIPILERAQEFRRLAEECRVHARASRDAAVSKRFLALARDWEDFASEAESGLDEEFARQDEPRALRVWLA